jgi:aspartyl-tRNA(Asn)/glutamyl-tRNA(Gln) amidotransferase subunit C
MSRISEDEIRKLAKMSRLVLSEKEVSDFSDELDEILSYVEQLKKVDTTDLDPTTKVSDASNVTRTDIIAGYGYKPEDLMKLPPALEKNQIKVKRML